MKKIFYPLMGIACLFAVSCASAPKSNAADIQENLENQFFSEEQSSDAFERDEKKELENQVGVENSEVVQDEITPVESELEEEKVFEDEIPELPLEETSGKSQDKYEESDNPEAEPVLQDNFDVESLKENPEAEFEKSDEDANVTESGETENMSEDTETGGKNENVSEEIDSTSNEEENTSEVDENSEDGEVIENKEDKDDFDEYRHDVGVEQIKPSRSITVGKYQILDICYPGSGWIYQGCMDENGNLDTNNQKFVFYGRKLGGQEQQFSLMARLPGKYYLHFFKNDILTDEYIDDFLEVIVLETSSDKKRVTAPSYADVVPPKATISAESIKRQKEYRKLAAQKLAEENLSSSDSKDLSDQKSKLEFGAKNNSLESSSEMKTVIQNSNNSEKKSSDKNPMNRQVNENNNIEKIDSSEEKNYFVEKKDADSNEKMKIIDVDSLIEREGKKSTVSPDSLLQKAKKLFDEKKYSFALDTLQSFFEKSVSRIDEALYLQGQILESKSEVQNIKGAIESYELLVRNYPASSLWNAANKRSIFLKRFYINIR